MRVLRLDSLTWLQCYSPLRVSCRFCRGRGNRAFEVSHRHCRGDHWNLHLLLLRDEYCCELVDCYALFHAWFSILVEADHLPR